MAADIPSSGDRLRALVRSCTWMMRVLGVVRESALPDAWVGAGVLRDLVWGECFGSGFDPAAVRDVDVAYFDPDDLSRDRDERATAALAQRWPDLTWEAINQAAVHTWDDVWFGGTVPPPLRSIAQAVATWPETATSVAIRLDDAGDIEICAPHGLHDLLGGVWRRNPAQVSIQQSRDRLGRHRPAERWPGVTVVPFE